MKITITLDTNSGHLAGSTPTVREMLRDLIGNLDCVQCDEDDLKKIYRGAFRNEPLYTDDGDHTGVLWTVQVEE